MTYDTLVERQRCEKIINNYLARHKHDLRKTEMLKSILRKIKTPCSPKKNSCDGGPSQG